MKSASFQKIYIVLLVSLFLGMIGSGLGLVSAWGTMRSLGRLITQDLEQCQVIYGVQTTLLERGYFTSLYLMGRKTERLDGLRRQRPDFEAWRAKAGRLGLPRDEQELIDRIGQVLAEYDRQSQAIITMYDGQDAEGARTRWLSEMVSYSNNAYELCESLIRLTMREMEQTVAAQSRQMERVALWFVGFLCVLAGQIWSLSLSISHRVLRPLHRLADSLGDEPPTLRTTAASAEHRIQLLGSYIGGLREEITEISSHLSLSQRQLLDAERLVSVGKLAAGVAHEIRGPLTSLRLRVFSMQRTLGDAQSQADLRLISEEITRLDGIVRDFLEFARPRQLTLQPCQIPPLLDKTLELLAHKLAATGVTVVRDDEQSLPLVSADPQQLKQVFVNLLNNAIEAMPGGGIIHLATWRDLDAAGTAAVRIVVQDCGPGIPTELQGTIFEPFAGTRAQGAGLGLWIVRRIMTDHGGGIDLQQSTPGGTTFSLWLPATAGSSDEQNPRS